MPLLTKRRVFAYKIEATPGTPETLTTTEAQFCFDPIIQLDIPNTDRAATGTLSRLASVPGTRSAKATLKCELAGSGTGGTPKPTWAGLLKACSMSVTGNVYSPTSDVSVASTVTLGLYEQGIYKVMSGCVGKWSLEAEVGKPAMIAFEFTGIWQAPVDASMVTLPTYSVIAPRVAAATFTIGGHTPKVSKISLDYGNTTKLLEDITTASGFYRGVVTDRVVTGKTDPEQELVAGWDIWTSLTSATESALNLVVGSTAGNTITFAGSRCQFVNIQEGDRGGVVNTDLDFQLNATSAGDNELSITFS